ncbi:MAG: type IV pilus modification PilV family protein [Gemmatimonadota bacterium]
MTGSRCRGASLVEVIVAFVVLGIGVLGAAAVATQATSSLRRAGELEAAVVAAATTLDSLRQRRTVAPGERRVGRVSVRWTVRAAGPDGAVRIDVTAAYDDHDEEDGIERGPRLTLSTLHLPPPRRLEELR